MNPYQKAKTLPADRWESVVKLKGENVKLLCHQCNTMRPVKDFQPLSKLAVLAECGHERRV